MFYLIFSVLFTFFEMSDEEFSDFDGNQCKGYCGAAVGATCSVGNSENDGLSPVTCAATSTEMIQDHGEFAWEMGCK